MNEWIKVSNALPPLIPKKYTYSHREDYFQKSIRVLCVVRQKGGKRMVKEGYCEVWNSGCVQWLIPGTINSVTHWMELPELPQEELSKPDFTNHKSEPEWN